MCLNKKEPPMIYVKGGTQRVPYRKICYIYRVTGVALLNDMVVVPDVILTEETL
jgi:hypothetical protein